MQRPSPAGTGLHNMDTRRLRALQPPAEVEKLLQALVSSRNLLPKGSYPIRDPSALPAPLQVIVVRATQEGRVWACWASSFETFLFTCEMSLPLSRERGAPVIVVNRYGERGELAEAAAWVADPRGTWLRCSE
jgi:hypothetical protein